jgi:hypothetical protein
MVAYIMAFRIGRFLVGASARKPAGARAAADRETLPSFRKSRRVKAAFMVRVLIEGEKIRDTGKNE